MRVVPRRFQQVGGVGVSGLSTVDWASPVPTLTLLSTLALLVQIDARIVAPLLPAIAESVQASIGATGLIVTAYALPYGLLQIAYGPLADRFGKVAVVRVAVLLFGLGTIACGLTLDLPSLMVFRIVTGAFAACVFPMTLAYIGDVVPFERRQGTIGNLVMVTSLATVLSPAVGGMVASVLSWRELFIACGVLVFPPALLLFRAPRSTRPSRPAEPVMLDAGGSTNRIDETNRAHQGNATVRRSPLAPFGTVLRNRNALTICALVFVEGGLTAGVTYLGAFLHEVYGLEYGRIGLLLGVYGIGSMAAARSIGAISRRVSARQLIGAGAVLLAASYLVLLGPPWEWLFAGAMLVMGTGFVLCHSTLQTRITEAVPALRGTAVSLFAFSLFLGSGAGTALLGVVLTVSGYGAVLLACGAGLALFGIIGAVAIGRSGRE